MIAQNFFIKQTNGIVLLALVDDDNFFIYDHIDRNCRASDGGVIAQSSFGQVLQRNELDLPDNSITVGDAAFLLKSYFIKPYVTALSLIILILYSEHIY